MADEELTEQIIGAAIEVHRQLGPGLLESTYESCLCFEFDSLGVNYERQKALPVEYKGQFVECGYRLDLIVEHKVILELKSVKALDEIHSAQLLSYLKLSGLRTGLLINFNVTKLINGLRRVAN